MSQRGEEGEFGHPLIQRTFLSAYNTSIQLPNLSRLRLLGKLQLSRRWLRSKPKHLATCLPVPPSILQGWAPGQMQSLSVQGWVECYPSMIWIEIRGEIFSPALKKRLNTSDTSLTLHPKLCLDTHLRDTRCQSFPCPSNRGVYDLRTWKP